MRFFISYVKDALAGSHPQPARIRAALRCAALLSLAVVTLAAGCSSARQTIPLAPVQRKPMRDERQPYKPFGPQHNWRGWDGQTLYVSAEIDPLP